MQGTDSAKVEGSGGGGDLAAQVAHVFAPGGTLSLAAHLGGVTYQPRPGQQDMAQAVSQAIAASDTLLVEAGTGVGKTYGYLVPVMLSGRRALISTATKSLQDQLFARDIPRLRDLLGVPVQVALLKGRANYLCQEHLAQLQDGPDMPLAVWEQKLLERITRWASRTMDGDLSHMPGIEQAVQLRARVTSTRESCLGADCPHAKDCFVNRARRNAMDADVVVINHHLFFADAALRETGFAELLPSVETVVFDEAHQLIDVGVAFLGVQFSTAQVLELAREAHPVAALHAKGLQPWDELLLALERSAAAFADRAFARLAEMGHDVTRLPTRQEQPLRIPADTLDWAELDWSWAQDFQRWQAALQSVREISPDIDALIERGNELLARVQTLAQPLPLDHVRWLEVGQQLRWLQSPLDIRDLLAQQRALGPRAWVYTSATLGNEPQLRWFSHAAGLEWAQRLVVPSPFDYPKNARLWVPSHLALPGDPAHTDSVARMGAHLAHRLGGRTFVLVTSLRAMRQIGELLRTTLAELRATQAALDPGGPLAPPLTVWVQGEQPKSALVEGFLQGRAVLVGSHTFWEGVDVPGEALQCVVIDKLPFNPPDDPIFRARERRVTESGGNAFAQLQLVDAAIALKQGAGRLIRTETDRGLLVIADVRLVQKSYGRQLLGALPPMTRLQRWPEVQQWLADLAGVASAEGAAHAG
ncbi:ATP-dependent DNA helicase [Amphibiibacter pelophylacis]|uniref:ATP-dependent DNA helicase n=1 Tax=Amphibiibacter pelophylacis TaxID=1799477 RepID=A0ACC6NZD5_9BURK